MSESILQDTKECYFTGSQCGLDRHHVYGGPNRKNSEKYGCWVYLKHNIHMDLHERDKRMDLRLKQDCQRAFEKIYDRETFMRIFGRNYLDD